MRWRVRITRVTVRVRPGGELGIWVLGLPCAAGSPTWASPRVPGRCFPSGCGLQGLLGSPGLAGGCVCRYKHQHQLAFRQLSLWPQLDAVSQSRVEGPLSARVCLGQSGWTGRVDGRVGSEGWTLQEAGAWVFRANRTFWLRAGLSLCALPSPFAKRLSWNDSDSLCCLRGASVLRVTLEAHRGFTGEQKIKY